MSIKIAYYAALFIACLSTVILLFVCMDKRGQLENLASQTAALVEENGNQVAKVTIDEELGRVVIVMKD